YIGLLPLPDSAPPGPSHFYVPNDSGPVLARPPNRRAPNLLRCDFGKAAPFTRRSGIRRNCAPGYSWPSLLYQDLFQNNIGFAEISGGELAKDRRIGADGRTS